MKLTLSKPVAGALLALSLTCGGALAANLPGENWCRVEPNWKSSLGQKLDLQSLMNRREPARRKVAVRRPVERTVAAVRPAPVAVVRAPAPRVRQAAAPTWSEPAPRNVEVASCAGGHASILCPGYQLVGIEY